MFTPSKLMVIVTDKSGQQWEVYRVKPWSFPLLVPLVWNLLASLPEFMTKTLRTFGTWPFLAGLVGFILVNADYMYVVRTKRSLYQPYEAGASISYRQTPLAVWVSRPRQNLEASR